MTDPNPLLAIIRNLSRPLQPLPTETPARLTSLPGIKAVIFDVYGTLFVSGSGDVGTAKSRFKQDAVREALRACDIPVRNDLLAGAAIDYFFEAIAAEHGSARERGVDFPEIVVEEIWQVVLQRLLAEKVIGLPVQGISLEQIAVAFECRVNPVWPMPGARELLEALHQRPWTMGIVSNAQFFTPLLFASLLDKPVDEYGFEPDLTIWSYAHRLGKPSPDLFKRLLKELDERCAITPSEAVYVGNDMRNDVWPAQGLGMKTVLFAGDQRSLRLREDDADCRGVVPDAVITELGQLTGLLV